MFNKKDKNYDSNIANNTNLDQKDKNLIIKCNKKKTICSN